MEPREFWERNSVLAEAFCASDDQVRHAQSVLDEAQAERSRALAAFAVTVGSDGTIADLMGLNEREVRLARRTVGRGNARTVAERLLSRGQQPGTQASRTQAPPAAEPQPREPPPNPEPAPVHPQASLPQTSLPQAPIPQPRAESPGSQQRATPREKTTSTTGQGPEPQPPVVWSASMDSVLLWSWKSGLDLQTVAAELGLDVRALLLRVQALAADGLLTPAVPGISAIPPPEAATPAPAPPPSRRSGRHRRHHHDGSYAGYVSPTTTFPRYAQH